MSTNSKKHHFIPKTQLKRFSKDKKKNIIFVFDKKLGRTYQSTVKDKGCRF